ncbi:DUF5034 domain-containing protein [Dyadobacter sp. NIV53]|uniref:DUF5034 domain-containing protein n=1 Tax=Dyadobacter sp. NIV53 TaxID=2861765 RepID=UPI001C86E466|nr:DUF5034 domain-containing protein [Dyadobacter sp. NIV53]
MKINKILLLLLFPLMAEVLVACCDCTDPLIGHYTNKTIVVNNIDNSGSEPMTTTANSVPKEAYGIRTQLNREETACLNPFKYLFIQTAYATSCGCPPPNQLLARDSVIAIQIFTLNDFDVNHPANSDISDYFKIFKGSSFSTIANFIKMYNTVLYSKSELELSFDALLMIPPNLNQNNYFKIKIILSDGRTLEGTTTSIDLI